MDPVTKLVAARTRLILDRPFLGALVLRLPLEAGDPAWCDTTATDARTFYFNPGFIAGLSNEECEFVLCHEAMHCALSHFARRGHRNKGRWDQACDLAVNPILVREGLTPPPGSLLSEEYEGMSAEEIYPFLADHPLDEEPLDQHLYDGNDQAQSKENTPSDADPITEALADRLNSLEASSEVDSDNRPEQGDHSGCEVAAPKPREADLPDPETDRFPPRPLDALERENLNTVWQQRIAGAAQQARQAGKLSANLAALADLLLQPQLSWRSLLARYMSTVAREEHSYARPSLRRGEPAIFPGLRGGQVELAIALDVSGSISVEELSEFAAEVDAVKGQVKARVTVLLCDKTLKNAPWIYEPWEPLELPRELPAGGGTDFRPVFEHLQNTDLPPDVLVYFTDGRGRFPTAMPSYPVIWLIKGPEPVPWGQRIQLN